MNELLEEMSTLKHLRDDVVRRGERQMDRWLQDVEAQSREVDKLRKEMPRGGCPSKSRLEVHKRAITILGEVTKLKKIGNRNVLEDRIGAAAILKGNYVEQNGDGSSSETVERFLGQIASEKPLRFSSKEIKSFTSNLSTRLGRGGYGEVFKGQFPSGVQIAVKVLKNNVRDVVKKQFMAEVGTMGRTYHRNLVRLYGFCFETNMKALVYEFVENGSLDKILYDNHLKLEWGKLYDIATETAKGLSYLHENCHKRIIHCDVKAGNVLIDSNLCPKVADFGLAKLCNWDSSHIFWTQFRGTEGYAAPEVGTPCPITCKCDVYSFGMLLFEILGRKKNINRNVSGQHKWFPRQVWEKFEKGQLEEIIMDCGIEVKDREKAKILSVVALWCSQYEPANRPSMSTVAKYLEEQIRAASPPYPFPRVVASGEISMITTESNESISSMVSSVVDITSNENFTRTRVPISFSRVSSEDSLVYVESRQVDTISPLPEPTEVLIPEEKKEEVITVVLMVYMHCGHCAHKVRKCLRKLKGVQTASADLERSQVIVKGIIEPQQLVEYIYKKTNKRAMIVQPESEKADEPKATVEAKVKAENKNNKHGALVESELEKTEKATARTERRKKQERVVPETFLEIKPSKRVVTVMNKSEMEEEKEIVHRNPVKRRDERKEGVGVGRTNLEKKKEENMGSVKPNHEKKHEEKGAANTIQVVKEEEMTTAKFKAAEEERKGIKVMKNKVEKYNVKGKPIEEGEIKMEMEGKENVYYAYEDPPQNGYVQRKDEYYHGSFSYPPQLFSDENPNACSIQ